MIKFWRVFDFGGMLYVEHPVFSIEIMLMIMLMDIRAGKFFYAVLRR